MKISIYTFLMRYLLTTYHVSAVPGAASTHGPIDSKLQNRYCML